MNNNVSIVISVANEKQQFITLLEHLLEQITLNDEIIISLSPHDNNNAIIGFCMRYSNIHLLDNPDVYSPSGFNKAISKAKNGFIVLCGARSFISREYIEKTTRILSENPQIGCVGGRIIHTAQTDTGKAIAKAMGAPFGMGVFSFRSSQKSGYSDTVSVPVFRKDIFATLGLFDESLVRNQDDDYSYRIQKSGLKIWHETSLSSLYFVREKFSQVRDQFFQYGFWKNYVNRKHRTITTLRQLAPPAFIIALIVLLCISLFLFAMAALFYICFFFILSAFLNQLKPYATLKTLFAFIIMHFSYGAGYLAGFFYAFVLNNPASSFAKKITR